MCIYVFFKILFIYLRERQIVTEIARESTSGEEREKQAPAEQGA